MSALYLLGFCYWSVVVLYDAKASQSDKLTGDLEYERAAPGNLPGSPATDGRAHSSLVWGGSGLSSRFKTHATSRGSCSRANRSSCSTVCELV